MPFTIANANPRPLDQLLPCYVSLLSRVWASDLRERAAGRARADSAHQKFPFIGFRMREWPFTSRAFTIQEKANKSRNWVRTIAIGPALCIMGVVDDRHYPGGTKWYYFTNRQIRTHPCLRLRGSASSFSVPVTESSSTNPWEEAQRTRTRARRHARTPRSNRKLRKLSIFRAPRRFHWFTILRSLTDSLFHLIVFPLLGLLTVLFLSAMKLEVVSFIDPWLESLIEFNRHTLETRLKSVSQ